MDESTTRCLQCGVTLTLDLPGVIETPAGEKIDAATMDQEMLAEALRDYMHGLRCPSCRSRQMRITLPDAP